MIVVDASLVLAWAYSDERTEAVVRTLKQVATEGGIAPVIWPLEIANSLELSLIRKRIQIADRDQIVATLDRLNIEVEALLLNRVWSTSAQLARRHGLTVYDATYLELALRLRLPLASLDKELIAAARAEGVAVLP